MSRSLNKAMLIGNVGGDPEIRTTSTGTMVAKVSLATNRSYQDRDGRRQEETSWHRLTFFGRLAEIVEQYVKRGDRLFVEGRISYSQSQDDQGGVRYWTDVIVNEMVMLGGREGEGVSSGEGGGGVRRRRGEGPPSSGSTGDVDDDLPF